MVDASDLDRDVAEAEREALHDLTIAVEHVHRAYGDLLSFHHEVGRAVDHLRDAEASLRAAGHEAYADRVRTDVVTAGVVGDRWTHELVEEFHDGFRADVDGFEELVRADLAGGERHLTERARQAAWRDDIDRDG